MNPSGENIKLSKIDREHSSFSSDVLSVSFDEKIKAIYLGISGTILIHFMFILIFLNYNKHNKNRLINNHLETQYNDIELVYAEANPEVFSNLPDRSKMYSFKDQQAADKDLKSDDSHIPQLNGTEENSKKIVQGKDLLELNKNEKNIESGYYSYQEISNKDSQGKIYNDLDFNETINKGHFNEIYLGAGKNHLKNHITESGKDINIIPLSDIGDEPDIEVTENKDTLRPLPMKRPKVIPDITIGPIAKNISSASKFGDIALNSVFSEFGDYQLRFYSALQTLWYNEIKFYDPVYSPSVVIVSFILESDGKIRPDSVETVYSSAEKVATEICKSAIIRLSPFNPWTSKMVEVYGYSRKFTINFRYY